MSGKHEKDMKYEQYIKDKLQGEPDVLVEYYYSLIGAGKSYMTTYRYINYILNLLNFTFEDEYKQEGKQFYLEVKPVHINKYISSLRNINKNGEVKKASDSIVTVHWSALNSFFQFLTPEYIATNPVAATQRPKMKDNPNVTYLTAEEISSLLKYVKNNASDDFVNRILQIRIARYC